VLASVLKRGFDLLFSVVGLILFSPIFVFVAVLIKRRDGGALLYSQERIGMHGVPFRMHKFRTMIPGADKIGLKVTQANDERITPVGRFLRRHKLDEMPQLFNVLVGDMSLVGPRPEVADYVDGYTDDQRAVLEIRPGITDPATLAFRDEEGLLAGQEDVDRYYREVVVPKKIAMNLEYAARASLYSDILILLDTLKKLIKKAGR
jgi:lipopolysaccharide/colanic/teichoic acid biosynthesis glycosyltransferase